MLNSKLSRIERATSVPKQFPLRRLYVGLVFLANPMINLFDLLPDFIGCLLILSAISLPAETAPYFADARERFGKLFWLEISKIPAALLMMIIYGGDMSQRSIITVFAMTYAILELILVLPAFHFLYAGFFYLGERYGCNSTIVSDRMARPETLPQFTTAFFIIRSLGACLPELALVPVVDSLDTSGLARLIQRAYPFFVILSILVVLVFALLFLHQSSRYTRRMRRDPELPALFARLAGERREVIAARAEMRGIRGALMLFVVGAGLSIDLTLDNFNLLPDIFAAAIFFVAILMLKPYLRHPRAVEALLILWGAVSLIATVLSSLFYSEYVERDLYREIPGAISAYRAYLSAAFVECILALAVAVAIALVLSRMAPIASDSFGEEESRQTAALRRSMKREAALFSAVFSLASLATLADAILRQYAKTIVVDPNGIAPSDSPLASAITLELPLLEWSWLIPVALSLAAFGIMLHLIGRYRAEVEETFADRI